MGEVLLAELNAMAARCPRIGAVHGKGLVAGVQMVSPGTTEATTCPRTAGSGW